MNCYEGEIVRKGQVLFTLDSRATDVSVDCARRLLAVAQANVDQLDKSTTESLWHNLQAHWQLAVAQGDLDAVLAQKNLLQVVSPLSGTVVLSQIRPGDIPDPTRQWIDIVDTDRLAVDVSVSDSQMRLVRMGQDAQIAAPFPTGTLMDRVESSPTKPVPITGKVRLVDAQTDLRTGMGSFDVSIPASAGLHLGQLVQVNVVVEEHRNILVVPAEALVEQPDGGFIIDLVFSNSSYPVKVRLGLREGDTVEVAAPELQAGQTIVTTGAYSVVGRSKLHEINDND